MIGLHHLDAEELEKAPKPTMFVAGPFAEENIVEEQILHHRRHHAVHLGPRFVHQHLAQPADLRCDVDHDSCSSGSAS